MLAVSEKRRIAARINGAKSRGPKTPEGKARSSRNAVKHGFFSTAAPLSEEDLAACRQFLDGHVAFLRPADPMELSLVRQMAAVRWDLRSALALETQALAAEIDRQPRGPY